MWISSEAACDRRVCRPVVLCTLTQSLVSWSFCMTAGKSIVRSTLTGRSSSDFVHANGQRSASSRARTALRRSELLWSQTRDLVKVATRLTWRSIFLYILCKYDNHSFSWWSLMLYDKFGVLIAVLTDLSPSNSMYVY
eukprot:TRINITY_DN1260_c0_g1_i1.p1 TRINITY_DN1260_c0_g1~~TRINITY_DN1260_c0_g1_i1.p1  ORF type:complete len:138 (-),score=5.36 TRINITY_DN1260_c0_g1_i1:263-676(-)